MQNSLVIKALDAGSNDIITNSNPSIGNGFIKNVILSGLNA